MPDATTPRGNRVTPGHLGRPLARIRNRYRAIALAAAILTGANAAWIVTGAVVFPWPVWLGFGVGLMLTILAIWADRATGTTTVASGYVLGEGIAVHAGLVSCLTSIPGGDLPALIHVGTRQDANVWREQMGRIARLRSPHIQRLLDAGCDIDGRPYAVVEQPEGMTISDLVDTYGPCPADRAVYLLAQIAHAIRDVRVNGLADPTLEPSGIRVGIRAGNADWITIDAAAMILAPGPSVTNDLRAFAGIAYFLMTGHAPPPDITTALHDAPLPFLIKQQLEKIAQESDNDMVGRLHGCLHGLMAALPPPAWNNDRALAWWTTQGIAS